MLSSAIPALLALTGAAMAQSSSECSAPILKLEGYGAGTTGGGSATPIDVKTCDELKAAARQGGVIRVTGFLDGCGTIDLTDNTTLEGGRGPSFLSNGGVRIKDAHNVIVRNMAFGGPLPGQPALAVEGSTQIWIDHNDFNIGGDQSENYFGAELEITGSDLVTVSWNLLMQAWKVSVVKGNDGSYLQEAEQPRVTYHHNFFFDFISHGPSISNTTAHLYSNCFDLAKQYSMSVSHGAKALVESNVFAVVNEAIVTDMDPENEGSVTERNNEFYASATRITKKGHVEPPYEYTVDPVSCICDYVCSNSGKYIVA